MEIRVLLRGRGHARHDEFALRVLFILEFFDGALAAGAHRTQSGMPTEVRQVESQRETCVQQILLRVRLVGLPVDVNSSHRFDSYFRKGQRFSRMWRSKSSRKYFSALCKGSAAPGASAQNVCPGPQNFV